jgi:glycosyltransferase involved in cell wall biosynthesis
MKILVVSQYFYPENFRLNDVMERLHCKGHEVSVLTGMPNYPIGKIFKNYSWWKDRFEVYNGIKIYRTPLFLRREGKGWQLFLNYLSFSVNACILAPIYFFRQDFDLIIGVNYSPATVGIPAVFMKKVKNTKMIFWIHDLWPQTLLSTGAINSKVVLKIIERMMSWIYRNSDLLFVQSRSFIKEVTLLQTQKDKIKYIPNWAEDLYQPIELIKNRSSITDVPYNGFIIMFAGSLGKAQSFETIIEAAVKTKGCGIHWVIIGNGRKYQWIKNQIHKNKLDNSVHLLGSKPMHIMPQYFSMADALLVSLIPDKVLSKTIPGKVQSYLACGKPMLGSIDGESALIINESKSGFVAPAGNALELANKAIKLSKLDLHLIEEMSQNALKYYKKNFDSDMLLSKIENEMNALIKD